MFTYATFLTGSPSISPFVLMLTLPLQFLCGSVFMGLSSFIKIFFVFFSSLSVVYPAV